MQLNGEDKKIRALFCELKRDEERISPLFTKTWNIAEAEFHRRGFSQPRFHLSSNLLGFATAIVVVGLVLAATVLLPRYLLLRPQPKQDYTRKEVAAGPRVTSDEPSPSGKVPANSESGKPTYRMAANRRSVHAKKSQVASVQRLRPLKQNGLSGWQSPTAKLLRSTGDEFLRFVPQINESAEEMKKFLANDLN